VVTTNDNSGTYCNFTVKNTIFDNSPDDGFNSRYAEGSRGKWVYFEPTDVRCVKDATGGSSYWTTAINNYNYRTEIEIYETDKYATYSCSLPKRGSSTLNAKDDWNVTFELYDRTTNLIDFNVSIAIPVTWDEKPFDIAIAGGTDYPNTTTSGKISAQLKDEFNDPVNGATCLVDYFNHTNDEILSDQAMSEIGTSGVYTDNFNMFTTVGMYTAIVNCSSGAFGDIAAHTFQVYYQSSGGGGLTQEQNQTLYDINQTTTSISILVTEINTTLYNVLTNQTTIYNFIDDVNTSIMNRGDSAWITATGFQTESTASTRYNQLLSDIANANNSIHNVNISIFAHGDNTWITATGFETESDASDRYTQLLNDIANANNSVYSINTSIITRGDTVWITATGFETDANALSRFISLTNNLTSVNNTVKDINTSIISRGDVAWITAVGFSTHSASDIWNVAVRTLTDYNQTELWIYLSEINATSWNIRNDQTLYFPAWDATFYNWNNTLLYVWNDTFFNVFNFTDWNESFRADTTPAEVWAYATRTLTDYNQTQIWDYLNQLNTTQLSYFPIWNTSFYLWNNTLFANWNVSIMNLDVNWNILWNHFNCTYSGYSICSYLPEINQTVYQAADYNQIAAFVWNYTSRNLTYYNQSIADNIQACLRDSECSNWWINTTLSQTNNTINNINSTASQIKSDTQTLLNQFDCASQNEVCTRLQNILNNATDIQARVYSLNTTQIQSLQTGVNNIYTDTQYIRSNMATASGLQDVNNTVNSMNSSMATYSQVQNVQTDLTWVKNNVATQEQIENNFTDIRNKLTNMNTTLQDVYEDITSVNATLATKIDNAQTDITWIKDNVVTSTEINNNFTETFYRLSNINSTVVDTKSYLYGIITTRLTELNTTTQDTYSYILANVSPQENITEILNQINNVQNNLTFVKNNMFYQGNATGSFLVDYLSTIYVEPNSRAETWVVTRDLLGNQKTVSSADCDVRQKGISIADATISISSGGVYAYWDVPYDQPTGEYYWNCTLTGSTLNLQVPFFVSGTAQQINQTLSQDFNVRLSDFGEVAAGGQYRVKVWITDYLIRPKNADTTPTVTMYDPLRNIIVQNIDMSLEETGIYSYNYTTSSSQTDGVWEAVVTTVVNGITNKYSDYWELRSSPAQVKINSIADNTIPSITADATITNEGTGDQEYRYEYCVVSNQTNQCGGGDDIDYASGSKLIKAGETWNAQLSLDKINQIGDYWFKVVVYFGTESSGASKLFSAVEAPSAPSQLPAMPTGAAVGISATTTTTVPPVATESKSFSIPSGSSAKIEISKSDDLKIQEIEIKVKNDVVNAKIDVRESSLPVGIPAVVAEDRGAIYKYLEITKSNITDDDISVANIRFKVERPWTTDNFINFSTIQLNKYKDGDWIGLPTDFLGSDDAYHYFEAQTSSFSLFAISGERLVLTPLFDLNVKIPVKYKEVQPGEEVLAQFSIVNAKKTGLVDVNITYGVLDWEGNLITGRHETVALETQTSFVRSLNIPSDLKPGEYFLFGEIVYNDIFANSGDSFKVVVKSTRDIEEIIIISQIFIIFVLSGIAVLILNIYRKKRGPRKSADDKLMRQLEAVELKFKDGHIDEIEYHEKKARLLKKLRKSDKRKGRYYEGDIIETIKRLKEGM
jgi:PGF-pre-PGF domain-containing protein